MKPFLMLALCALLCASSALAQDQQSGTKAKQDVTIIIQQQQVQFIAQKAGGEMRLQVFDQSGELVFDSGVVEATEVNWPLQAVTGEALKSGLYAYTLSTKEAGAAEARLRRGHFIVDRAKDRDDADRLWVTSQNESGVSAELTVAKDEAGAVAGAVIGERTVGQRTEMADRDPDGRAIDAESQSHSQSGKGTGNGLGTPVAAAAAGGTVGQIAKFTSSKDVGNSVITELNGAIGVGTTTPQSKLTVQAGGYGLTHTSGAVTLGTFITTAAGGSGWFGTKSNHPLNFFTNDGLPQMTLGTSGNVGIGTTTPVTKLHVLSSVGGVSAIYGESATGPGVYGKSTSSRGVYGESDSYIGVWGKSTSSSGVFGESAVSSLTAAGVYGKGAGSGSIGVIGESNLDNAVGVFGVSASPDGVGVYARNLSGGRALFAEGNVAQDLSSNSVVKAMLYVDWKGGIIRCYNGIANSSTGNCGFVITKPLEGVFRINYGFPVDNRFVSVTCQYRGNGYFGPAAFKNAGANFRFFDSTSIEVFTFSADNSSDTQYNTFMIILY